MNNEALECVSLTETVDRQVVTILNEDFFNPVMDNMEDFSALLGSLIVLAREKISQDLPSLSDKGDGFAGGSEAKISKTDDVRFAESLVSVSICIDDSLNVFPLVFWGGRISSDTTLRQGLSHVLELLARAQENVLED